MRPEEVSPGNTAVVAALVLVCDIVVVIAGAVLALWLLR